MGNIIIKLSEIYAKLNNVITKTSTDEGFLKSNGNKDSSGRLFTNTESNKLNNTIEKTSTDNGFLKSNGSIDSSTYNYYTHPRPFTFNFSLPQTNDTQTYHSSAQSPVFGGPFNIPSITVDGSGHVNKIMSTHVTLPSLPNASSSASGIAKAYNGTTTAIGSAASNGTDNGIYARGDHKHNITKQTITDLGIPDNNHKHDNTYLKLSGGTLTGLLSSNSNIGTSATIYGNKIMKNGGSNTQILLANGDVKSTNDFAINTHTHGWKRVWYKENSESGSIYYICIFVNPELGLANFIGEVDNTQVGSNHRTTMATEATNSTLKKEMFPIDSFFIDARIDGSVRFGLYGPKYDFPDEFGFESVKYSIVYYDSTSTGGSAQTGYGSALYKPQGTYQQLSALPER